MPAAASSAKAPSRRKEKHLSPEELKDIEQKRLKGELSCAECRRLKLRCDKKVPCSSCSRRGCESICPCGILEAGAGTRFILASTDLLHSKISLMSSRIRALEDALAIFQASVSSERHPLLEDELLKIKFGSEVKNSEESEILGTEGHMITGSITTANQSADATTLDAFGTLTLGEEGEMKYFGRSAGSETLILVRCVSSLTSPAQPEDKNTVPPEVYALALDFNQGTQVQSSLTVSDLLAHLPPRSHAETLAQSYIDHASLFFRAMKKDELFDIVLPLLYPSSISLSEPMSIPEAIDFSTSQTTMPTHSEGSNNHTLPSPHLLATVYFTFALGSFFDLSASIKIYVSESQRWFELGRKALTPLIFAAAPSSAEDTVRALGLMATYCSMSGKKHARDSAWCGMSLAAKVAQGSGMHRDPARWHMDPVTVQRRRALWWEVCTSDISHSVALGRPPSIHLSFVDCEFPTDEEATLSDTGEEVMGFWRMKYTFAKESFAPVISTTLSAKSPTYSTIVDLDRKIRELSLPPGFKPYVSLYDDGPEIYHNSHLALRDFYASQHRTVTMLYLHRSFFAHAMLTHPSNPLMSPFALSFLAAYRAASVIIKAAVHFYDRCSAVVPRVWFLTYHVFSAAMTVGTVVKRSPNSSIAKSALNDLGQALNLFEKCASSSPRNRIAYALLRRLKEKADRAYASFLSNTKESASITPK
ncbi:fungal-specific transcription factor domain-containing protein, partial [Lentinula boryana]